MLCSLIVWASYGLLIFLTCSTCGQAEIFGNRNETHEEIARSAERSLQNQRNAFMSAILLYLNKPEDGATETALVDTIASARSQVDPWSLNQVSPVRKYFKHEDRVLNIRVLRSVQSETLSRRRRADSWPPTWVPSDKFSADWGPFPEFFLKDTLGSEKTSMVEEMAQQTPFNRSDNGDLIMRELPMVERRSIPQFGGMVTLYTRTSPLRLLYYGNWCGSGGMGPALDAIDHCCMEHDHCYGRVQRKSCIAFQKPYTIHYSWRWDDKRQQAYCLRTGDRCGDLTCDCDRVAAACFSRHMINSRLEGNRLRKHKRPFRH